MDIRRRILATADRCVLCGMCLPHCPTYRLAHEEAESPRGRVVLAQALAAGRIDAGATLAAHIDHCLGCRACESVCPSRVRYGQLLLDVRELLAGTRGLSLAKRAALVLVASSGGQRVLAAAAGLQRKLAVVPPTAAGLPGRAAMLLPHEAQTPPALPPLIRARGERRGAVALFVGCTGKPFDGDALAAAVRLLTAAGFDVHVPPAQGCCGALHAHAGAGDKARALAERNRRAFDLNAEAIVSIASGCAATLTGYAESDGTPLPLPVREITDFLAETLPAGLRFAPLERRVAIHEPCTQRVLKATGAARRLLARIPGVELTDLPENDRCCGAAGAHLLEQPQLADALAAPKAAAARACGIELLVSSNIGCALHLRARLAGEPPIEVLHPVTLAARRLVAD